MPGIRDTDHEVSPAFAGRPAELTLLTDAYERARAGVPGAVLVAAEAGGGKTRLVSEFAGPIDGRVLAGGCVDLGSPGLPYAPFTTALRRLLREAGDPPPHRTDPAGPAPTRHRLPQEAGEPSSLWAEPGELARLLPELGPPPENHDPSTARTRLFGEVLSLLERLAARRPLVLVVEDAHWADRSTSDLLAFLLRNLRDSAILVVVTFRSDELHRTHPMRSVIAGLERIEGVVRLDLPRLTRAEVARQLTGIVGHEPEPALLETVYRRSSGVPLFVEAAAANHAMPDSLRDLLLTGVTRLPERSQEVLRVASAGGTRVGHRLLAAVTGLADVELSAVLRPAVDANVIVPDADGYAFRHALIRESVNGDLLPGERGRTHRRYADTLTAEPALGEPRRTAFELAMHWYAAHDDERALEAAWRAAGESADAFAHAEQTHLLERVLELWDRVPDARTRVGADHVEVLERAARAAGAAGEPGRGLAFVQAALAEVDPGTDPERVALLLCTKAVLSFERGVTGPFDDLLEAERLVPLPSPARAEVLALLGRLLTLRGRDDRARPINEETLRLAERFGASAIAADALTNLAIGHAHAGRLTEALDAYQRAGLAAERAGAPNALLRSLANTVDTLDVCGRSERAVEVGEHSVEVAASLGRARTQGVWVAANLAGVRFALGRWDEAARTLDRAAEFEPAPIWRGPLLIGRAELAVARGDGDSAGALLAEVRRRYEAGDPYPQQLLPLVRLEIERRLSEGDTDGAAAATERCLAEHDVRSEPRHAWPLLISGVRAAAAAPDPVLAVRLRACAAELPAYGPVMAAQRLTFLAESARSEGTADRAACNVAVAAWESLGRPYPLAYALLRAAEAAVAAGQRDDAVTHLDRAACLTEQLRARPLCAEIGLFMRRARLSPAKRAAVAVAEAAGQAQTPAEAPP